MDHRLNAALRSDCESPDVVVHHVLLLCPAASADAAFVNVPAFMREAHPHARRVATAMDQRARNEERD